MTAASSGILTESVVTSRSFPSLVRPTALLALLWERILASVKPSAIAVLVLKETLPASTSLGPTPIACLTSFHIPLSSLPDGSATFHSGLEPTSNLDSSDFSLPLRHSTKPSSGTFTDDELIFCTVPLETTTELQPLPPTVPAHSGV